MLVQVQVLSPALDTTKRPLRVIFVDRQHKKQFGRSDRFPLIIFGVRPCSVRSADTRINGRYSPESQPARMTWDSMAARLSRSSFFMAGPVCLDGVDSDVEIGGDLAVSEATRDQAENFGSSGGSTPQPSKVIAMLDCGSQHQ